MPGLPAFTVEKMMSVKEVAEALGVTPEAIKWHIRKMYPDAITNGIETKVSEYMVTEIKKKMIPTSQLVGSTTRLEMQRKAEEVLSWMRSEIERMRIELEDAQPAIECHAALMKTESHMSITDAAKHFGLHPRTQVLPYLRELGYLTLANKPTQAAIDADYLELKETLCADGEMRSQAVVSVRQLEVWRLRVVPQIKRWIVQNA